MINDRPLIVNPDANWNRQSDVVKEDYLERYMAKNLYRFECPARSEYDTETKVRGKKIEYIQLIPLDYFEQKPDKSVQMNGAYGTKFITFRTNNPGKFWKAP